jgi:hypothetical protein
VERKAAIILVTSPSIRVKNSPFLSRRKIKSKMKKDMMLFVVLFKREETVPRANQSSRLE